MRFVKESRIAAPPKSSSRFTKVGAALARLTPPWERVEVIEGGDSILPGSRVVLRMKTGPIPMRWIAEHVEYDRGRSFSDRQVSGPFQSWLHRHLFLDDGAGGTILRDEIDYEPPGGAIGRALAGRFIHRKLEKMFNYRHEMTRKIAANRDFD